MTKLSLVRAIGRFKNKITGQQVNIKQGRKMSAGVDVYFYLRSGTRVFISDRELHENWEKLPNTP